jgi:hydrogenase assembly chaperone HypC/HupF
MCVSIPGRVTQVQGAMAEVEERDGGRAWFNALPQPDIEVGDYVLSHANLIIAIISEKEALEMIEAYEEAETRLTAYEESTIQQRSSGGEA